MQQTYLLCCPCHFGLERTLRFEISKIGGTDIAAQDGRVLFRGDTETIAKQISASLQQNVFSFSWDSSRRSTLRNCFKAFVRCRWNSGLERMTLFR